MWARKDVMLFSCPKSYITSDSEALVEEFFVRRRMGAFDFSELFQKLEQNGLDVRGRCDFTFFFLIENHRTTHQDSLVALCPCFRCAVDQLSVIKIFKNAK